jgi:hypothetical protein
MKHVDPQPEKESALREQVIADADTQPKTETMNTGDPQDERKTEELAFSDEARRSEAMAGDKRQKPAPGYSIGDIEKQELRKGR